MIVSEIKPGTVDGHYNRKRVKHSRVSESHTAFHESGSTAEKQQQREIIARFFIDNADSQKPLKVFSIPGEKWTFESMLYKLEPSATFVACESSTVTMQRMIPYMPRRKKYKAELRQWWIHECGGHVDAWKTNNSTLFNLDACLFWRGLTPSHWKYGGSRRFKYLYQSPNAVWIDTFSPLGCRSYLDMIRGITTTGCGDSVSCAFSFLIGRDSPEVSRVINNCPGKNSVEKRAAFLSIVIESCGVKWTQRNVFSHDSFNTDGSAKFGTVCGIISRKS